jgi:hypothetical protein
MPELFGGPDGAAFTRRLLSLRVPRAMVMLAGEGGVAGGSAWAHSRLRSDRTPPRATPAQREWPHALPLKTAKTIRTPSPAPSPCQA